MPRIPNQTDAPTPLPLPALPRSTSAHTGARPPIAVGATGSIIALVDSERCALPADAAPSVPDQRKWLQNGRSKSTGGLPPRYEKQGVAVQCGLETVAEIKVKVPKWKQFFWKFRKGSRKNDGSKVSKPTRAATSMEGKKKSGGESLRDNPTKGAALRETQVSVISSRPSPLPRPRENPSSSLWERRNVDQLSPLDLTRLRSNKPAKAR